MVCRRDLNSLQRRFFSTLLTQECLNKQCAKLFLIIDDLRKRSLNWYGKHMRTVAKIWSLYNFFYKLGVLEKMQVIPEVLYMNAIRNPKRNRSDSLILRFKGIFEPVENFCFGLLALISEDPRTSNWIPAYYWWTYELPTFQNQNLRKGLKKKKKNCINCNVIADRQSSRCEMWVFVF